MSKEELKKLKEKVEDLQEELEELTDEELDQIVGGAPLRAPGTTGHLVQVLQEKHKK